MSSNFPQVLPITFLGHPILRRKADPVTAFDAELRDFVADMIATLNATETGIGLAAPQVGRSLRIFLSTVEGEDSEGELIIGPPCVYINPVLSRPSKKTSILPEACLSIPGLRGRVERPLGITIEAYDLEGKPFKKEFYNYASRVLMHENDHLNGVLFIDRMDKKERRLLEPALQRLQQSHIS